MRLLALLLVLLPVLFARVAPALADDPPGGEIKVRWEGVTVGLLNGEEPREPFTNRFPNVPPENLKWQLYTGEVGGKTKQVYETRRWLWQPTWSSDGLRMSVRYNAYSQYQPDRPYEAGGLLSFDSVSATRAPSDVAFEFMRTAAFDVLPGGSKVLLATRMTNPLFPFESPRLYLVDPERKTAFAPLGLPGSAFPAESGSWSPDGAYVLLRLTAPQQGPILGGIVPQAFSIYSVSTADGAARLMMTQPHGVTSYGTGVWSPAAPHQVAFTQHGALWVFDPLSGLRRLTADHVFKIVDRPAWHDAQRVWIGNKLVDATSGEITTYEFGQDAAGVAVSPDGRYAVTFEWPKRAGERDEGQCPALKLPQNRVYLFDQATGAASLLKDCDGRSFIRFQWMGDSRHVVMSGADIYCCHGGNWRVVLKDVITGAETPLTNGFEAGVWAVVSPDGEKVIVTGDRLRVFAADGELLEETDPAVGFSVTSAAWAPDSQRFSFIVGPTGVEGP